MNIEGMKGRSEMEKEHRVIIHKDKTEISVTKSFFFF